MQRLIIMSTVIPWGTNFYNMFTPDEVLSAHVAHTPERVDTDI